MPTCDKEKGDTTVSPFLFTMLKTILSCIFVLLLCTTTMAEDKRTEIPIGDSPSLGPANAPITLIEFIDFQ